MSDLFENPNCWFSHVKANLIFARHNPAHCYSYLGVGVSKLWLFALLMYIEGK